MTTTQSGAIAGKDQWRRATMVNARIDALPGFGLSWGGRIGLLFAFLFANYDIGVFTITIPSVSHDLGFAGIGLSWPVAANLLAYGIGAYVCGWLADKAGRRRGLLLTVLILGLGGLLTAFSWNLASFTIFRFVTGAGMGAVLSLATAYLGELAPKAKRGRTISTIYFVQAIILVGVSFGSIPLITNLPGAWRYLYGFGALVLFVPLAFRDTAMMESPRWLAEKGFIDKAESLVAMIEKRMNVTGPPPEIPAAPDIEDAQKGAPFRELVRTPLRRRLIIAVLFWFLYYVAYYGFSSYKVIIFGGLGINVADSIFITVLSSATGPIASVVLILIIERVERRTLVIIGCVIEAIALVLLVSGAGVVAFTFANLIYYFMVSIVTPPAFTYTAEMFPTRARGTAAAIGDGVGHLGGAIAPFLVLPILSIFGARWTVIVIAVAVALAALSLAFGPRTKKRALTDIAT